MLYKRKNKVHEERTMKRCFVLVVLVMLIVFKTNQVHATIPSSQPLDVSMIEGIIYSAGSSFIEIIEFHEDFVLDPDFFTRNMEQFTQNGIIDEELLIYFLTENVGINQRLLEYHRVAFTDIPPMEVSYKIGITLYGSNDSNLYELIGLVSDGENHYHIMSKIDDLTETHFLQDNELSITSEETISITFEENHLTPSQSTRRIFLEIVEFKEDFYHEPDFYTTNMNEFTVEDIIDENLLFEFLTKNVGVHQIVLSGGPEIFSGIREFETGMLMMFPDPISRRPKQLEIISVISDNISTYIIMK